MKKAAAIILAAILVLALAGCGGSGAAEGRIGDTMETYFFDFTVNSAYTSSEYEGYVPAEGNQMLVADVTVKNTFNTSLEMYDIDFQAQWGDEGDDTFSLPITFDLENGVDLPVISEDQLPSTYSLAVDEERTGLLVYEVPAGNQDFSISYLEEYTDSEGNEGEGDVHFVFFTAESK